MRFRHWIGVVLAFSMPFSLVYSHSNRHNRGDIVRLAEDLDRASTRFSDRLRYLTRDGRLNRHAEELYRAAAHFVEAARGSSPGHLADDFREVSRHYWAVRQALHDSPGLGHSRRADREYYEFMKSWLDVVYSHDELSHRIAQGPGGGPYDPGYDAEETIRCKSKEFRYNECRASAPIRQIRIEKQKSSSACVQGRTFGIRGDRIWVDQGCDAEFRVSF